MKLNFRALMFRVWYWYISKVDKNAEVIFMNFGYHDHNMMLKLNNQDEPNRCSIQLYHRMVNKFDLKGKSILEIGSGRGGGLAYIMTTFSPQKALGIDLNHKAIKFSNRFYKLNGLEFMQGNAQKLSLEDNSFDFILNVESSHRYLDFNAFVNEVYRILKPDGYFLFTDFRHNLEFNKMEEILESFNLKLIEKQKINEQVALALKMDSERRINIVKKLAPKFLHKTAINFSGAEGSETYRKFITDEFIYYLYIFQKV